MGGIEIVALTDVVVRNAKPGPKPYKMGDSHGLFLLVQPSGGKLWRLRYRVDGREKKLAIGPYPEIGLGEARRWRDAAREAMVAVRRIERKAKLESARRTLQLVGSMFRYAVATARLKSDPTRDMKGALTSPTVTHCGAVIDPAGVGELLRSVDGYEG